MCHDISRGLSHIHSHSVVHYDIKPSNIFFVLNSRWGGTICKIGDFGLAGEAGAGDDGQEGDAAYMPAEALGTSAAINLLDKAGAAVQTENYFNSVSPTGISQRSNTPVDKLTSTESFTLLALDDSLAFCVKGQPRAMKSIVRRISSGLRDPGCPVTSFLFCRSAGVGKTWLAKTLAAQYYGSEKNMHFVKVSLCRILFSWRIAH